MSVTTSKPTILPNVPRPRYRFTADASVSTGNRIAHPRYAPGGDAAGFNIDVRETHATILARSGDATGVIAYGTDTYDLYVYDGANWQTYNNS